MASAIVEGLRATRYRQRLAALMRRSSCRSISFAIGTAPIHRNFFAETAAAIEGLPTGGTRKWNGVSHRQVQYGVHLKIDETAERATYDSEHDLLVVPKESEFDTVDGQARLLAACVHAGLNIEGRNLQQLDSECAARIVSHLYRLFESIAESDTDTEVAAKIERLQPESIPDTAFYAAARETLLYLRATWLAESQRHKLKPGSFMKIISITQRDLLHDVLLQAMVRPRRRVAVTRPGFAAARPPSRFLALQVVEPTTTPVVASIETARANAIAHRG
jgi:hypothetical protein